MINRLSLFLILISIAVSGCQSSNPSDDAESTITSETLLSHIEILSSNEYEGRAPATQSEDLTIDYLINQLQEIGVNPGMPDESFTQEIPLLGQVINQETATFTILQNGEPIQNLNYRADFMAWPSNESETVDISDAELVYVGYGIQAPEFEWDDFKDVDIEGKILVFKNSDPAYDPEIFDGDARLYYGRWSYKFEKAEELGARGAIIVHTTPTAGYGWSVIANSWGRERFSLKSDDDTSTKPEFSSWLTESSSEMLFSSAGFDLSTMLDAADDPAFTPVPLSGITIDVQLDAEYSNMSTRNVLGVIEGSDNNLKDEYLVFTAHYDHLGITEPVDGDSINNGAADNAAGVSALLNLAKAYQTVQSEMKRSALFLFVGAEEMGLLGSQYWAANPTVHPRNVTANFNMDAMQVYGETRDLVLIGYGRNTITDVIKEHAEQQNRIVKPDPNPGQGFFYRSDHFSLAKVGIPAIFPSGGNEFLDKPDNWNTIVDSLQTVNYHSVGDEINEYWDMAGMEQDVKLFFKASFDILNHEKMMEWQSGDEFEATRLQMLSDAE